VRARGLEVSIARPEGEAEDSRVEVQAALPVGGDRGDVVYTVESHRQSILEFLDQ
jgi:hypothetical protein